MVGLRWAIADKHHTRRVHWIDREGGTRGARLPFNHCALTFKPINPVNGDVAVMAPDGAVFNLEALVPYIRKYHAHPITGAPLELSDVTKISFSTNPQGEICCPVLGKVYVVSRGTPRD